MNSASVVTGIFGSTTRMFGVAPIMPIGVKSLIGS
jgi:hypothetical protein